MRLYPALLLVCLHLPGPAIAQDSAPGAKEFNEDLAKIGRLVKSARWRPALDRLQALLEDHQDQDYARARSAEIADWAFRCAFRSAMPPPDPKTLVAGELKSYNRRTGRVKLRYVPGKTRGDFQYEGGTWYFVGGFAGPHTLTVKGKNYPKEPSNSPMILGCLEKKYGMQVIFGVPPLDKGMTREWMPMKFIRLDKNGATVLFEKKNAFARPGRKYTLKFKVTRTKVSASLNGKSVGSGSKKKDIWGTCGFSARGWSEAIIEGVTQPSWLQGRIDTATQVQLEKFKKRYVRREYIPDWLFEDPKPAVRKHFRDRPPYPADVKRKHLDALRNASAYYKRKRFLAGLRHVRKMTAKDAPDSARFYLLARYHAALDNPESALSFAERSLSIDPVFFKTMKLKATSLARLNRRLDAAEAWKAMIKAHPNEREPYEEAASMLLLAGRATEAKAIIEKAVSNSVTSSSIAALNRMLVKAISGPTWTKYVEYKSPNYLIISDIDRATCAEAARILEEGYAAYRNHLKFVSKKDKKRFRVYLFSGRAGFLRYCQDLWGSAPGSAAGLYSPFLKQLLIWNLPDRESMMRTVRHEGFHQYLDRAMPDPPRWFDEGMAEFYETGRIRNGTLTGGQRRADHLEALGDRALMPSKKFLYLGYDTFYKGLHRNYAQAWLTIHFLRKGPSEFRPLFKKMMEVFAQPLPVKEAVDKAFEGVDMDSFDRHLDQYRQKLIAQDR